jgi:hypothetical protein
MATPRGSSGCSTTGSSHRGAVAGRRLRQAWPTPLPVHPPAQVSWLNQIGPYFSIVQRKVLMPNGFGPLAEVEDRLPRVPTCSEALSTPFQREFTRGDLITPLTRMDDRQPGSPWRPE